MAAWGLVVDGLHCTSCHREFGRANLISSPEGFDLCQECHDGIPELLELNESVCLYCGWVYMLDRNWGYQHCCRTCEDWEPPSDDGNQSWHPNAVLRGDHEAFCEPRGCRRRFFYTYDWVRRPEWLPNEHWCRDCFVRRSSRRWLSSLVLPRNDLMVPPRDDYTGMVIPYWRERLVGGLLWNSEAYDGHDVERFLGVIGEAQGRAVEREHARVRDRERLEERQDRQIQEQLIGIDDSPPEDPAGLSSQPWRPRRRYQPPEWMQGSSSRGTDSQEQSSPPPPARSPERRFGWRESSPWTPPSSPEDQRSTSRTRHGH